MPSDRDRNAIIEAIVRQVRAQLHEQLPQEDQTLDQIEETAGKIGRQVSQEVQKQLIDTQQPPRSPRQECACGGQARYKGHQVRSMVTAHGLATFRRAVYYCPACRQNLAPLDRQLGLEAGPLTAQVRAWTAYLGALMPFAQAATTLEMLTRISLNASTVERVSVQIGQRLHQQQQQQTNAHHHAQLPDPLHKPRRLYISMDGIFVPLRHPWKRDGTAGALTCAYHECKVGVVYEACQDKSGRDQGVKARAYTATLESVETFGPQLGTLAHQQGQHRTSDLVVLADGARWIWQVAAKQFSGAVQIVDFFHACQHLATLSEARFGKESAEGQAWQLARQEDLKANRLSMVLAEIRSWRPRALSKRRIRASEYRYFVSNADRMRYQTFLKAGYHIGSGVMEASCKQVVAQRMKLAGMHWRQETAEAVLTLRAAQLSSNPPDFRALCLRPN